MIDLHNHSDVSDGSDPPERIPELAAEAHCSAVALTDHDTMAGLPAARARADELGITFVPGCEVSCRRGTVVAPPAAGRGGGVHVLVYFVDDDASPLGQALVRQRELRHRRNLALVGHLAASGIPVTYELVAAESAGGVVGRPHIAAALVRLGVAESVEDAFDRFLSPERPGYPVAPRLDGGEVAALARQSGGVASLAHPFSLGLDGPDLARAVGNLAEAGVAGLECHYGRYSPRQRTQLLNLADRFGMVATGGSDYHGTVKPDLNVGTGRGDLKVPDRVLDALRARRPAV